MAWEVEVTDEWLAWYNGLPEGDQDEVAAVIGLLEVQGPQLGFPYTSGVTSSEHQHMRELRVQSRGRPLRMLYAFDPRWYDRAVPEADRLYNEHIEALRKEKLINE